MRVLIALFAAALMAQPSLAQPLEPGKPAGVPKARITANQEALMLGTGVAIMTAVGLVVGGGAGAGITTGPVFPLVPVVAATTTTG
jgi:hypothetical protein